MKAGSITLILIAATASLVFLPASAQPVLSGVSLYCGSRDGTPSWKRYWNTLGPDLSYNLYLFTGPTHSPIYLNGGNANSSLNPNLQLPLGRHLFSFAGDVPADEYVGINLYFNHDFTTPRITAVVCSDGSTNFCMVPADIMTAGIETKTSVPSSGALSFSDNGYLLTLSQFALFPPMHRDLVAEYGTYPDGVGDTVGSFALTVTEAPQTVSIEVSQFRICWHSTKDALYNVQYRSALTTNEWANLVPPVTGTGSQMCVTDDVAPGQAQRFYRVTLNLNP